MTIPGMRGFTLLELLVVLLLVGLLTALVPPLFSGAVPGARLKAAARDLAATMHAARSQAIARNDIVAVHLDSGTPPAYRLGEQRMTVMPAQISMQVAQAGSAFGNGGAEQVVRFFPDGSASDVQITLTGADRGYRLAINWLTGRVDIGDIDRDAL